AWLALRQAQLALKAYPICVNLALLASFGWSLWRPPTVVERLARLSDPQLPAHALPYIRKVTAVWCVFFALNAAVSLATALWASEKAWALYNGGVAYGLMGLLFSAEWVLRQRVKRRHAGAGGPPWMALEALLSAPGSARPVGLAPGQDWTRLARRREAWRSALEPLGTGAELALAMDDGFEFTAALLGAWSAGCTVVLPGDALPATAQALTARGAVLAGDFPGAMAAPPDPAGEAAAARALPALPVVVFTSGSTGQPAAVAKPRHCLEKELEALEGLFGGDCLGAAVISTVSHQHYYGLLFKTLWPLCAGRPSMSIQLKLPEEVALACAAAGKAVLVSSPALLKRLAGSPAAVEALAPARPALCAVFSSGGPLPWDAVWRCREALGQVPTEIYGSSETGGVAWRRRENEDGPWRAFPGVELRVEPDRRTLSVRSPHGAGAGWFLTEDLAVMQEGSFRLMGRADRVAKVEEKRVSLGALEEALGGHPDVAEARVLVLRGARDELGAVLKTAPGRLPADEAARREFLAVLRAHLAGRFEAVALPRRWRLVEELPHNSMGKTTSADLEALFARDRAPLLPDLIFARRGEKGVELELLLDPDLHWFQGHFPGAPILPGVVQVHWAVHFAAEHLGLQGAFRSMQALKFQRPLRPGQRIRLVLTPRADGRSFEFAYHTEAGRHASGRVTLD
ncbi:MAG TPA: AMP-binding protein, partial [bacterium]|nr:AMP-binding protein [bacterium]